MTCIGLGAVGLPPLLTAGVEGTSPAQTRGMLFGTSTDPARRGTCPERGEVPMSIVGGLDVHRQQITFDYLDTETGEVAVGQIPAADRRQLAAWLARRFADRDDRGEIEFSVEGCTGWRYVAEELAAAGMVVH